MDEPIHIAITLRVRKPHLAEFERVLEAWRSVRLMSFLRASRQ
jgi:hypothetical protein